MEHHVEQRSPAWFELKKKVALTASHFGDALGLGKGRSYDFLVSLVSDDDVFKKEINDIHTQYGNNMEATICEVYELLTGAETRLTGFWTTKSEHFSNNPVLGASPDAIVLNTDSSNYQLSQGCQKMIGLAEFKAPVYQMYCGTDLLQGIPRHYMAQIQGQMFVTGAPWCDFLAVCVKTKEILLKRVYFSQLYWQKISLVLTQFCAILKEAKQRKKPHVPINVTLDFQTARNLKFVPQRKSLFTGEDQIKIENLLQIERDTKNIIGPSKIKYTFEFLLGEEYEVPENLNDYAHSLLQEIDLQMKSESYIPQETS
ncbi:hypothetical protein LOTGIDRAFT_232288 [Lottia gigantea]|uniref:YqaJ viral recombinase domain-containing protein n=1 Tax=Lottia gigantea TaxID=225164 RepID=V4AC84_LOTGI|nr:hypothetical protein LOTGIDRAFT_232288 [Lottia gigantea]ESO94432.1 hypothetical protein LOTGIDRAFT_232288 [Lottia gigantea]